MPRIRNDFMASRPGHAELTRALVEELKTEHVSGQPLIYEQTFPTGALRVTVIWDRWDRLPHEVRTAVILRAYEEAELSLEKYQQVRGLDEAGGFEQLLLAAERSSPIPRAPPHRRLAQDRTTSEPAWPSRDLCRARSTVPGHLVQS